MYYNRIILVGRLTRDPELRATPDGMSVVRFTLAVDRGVRTGEEKITDFFDIVAFRQLADTVANYTTKGRLVLVEGKLQVDSFTDRDGNKRKAYKIVADNVRFLERMRDAESDSGEYDAPPASAATAAPRTVQRSAPAAPPATAPEPENDYDIDLDTGDFQDVADDPFR